MPITVVIIAYNEENKISDSIKSAFAIAREVIVVDSNSTDQTAQIAKDAGAKVYKTDWLGYGATKNYGASLASNDWVLSLDADERIDEELASTICDTALDQNLIYGWKRKSYLGEKWVKHSGWYPDVVYRLYNKQKTQWNLDEVHEAIATAHVRKKLITGHINHYTCDNVQQHLQTQLHYGALRARQWIKDGRSPSILKRYLGPTIRFLRTYIYRLGFLDGKVGISIAINEAKMVKNRYKMYDQLKQQKT